MAPLKDSFVDLERHRQLLENEVEKVRVLLQQWRLWEAEYEALKDEVTSLPTPVSQRDLARIRRDFDGQYVAKKEVGEIFGRTDLKPAEQVVSILSRRLEYVAKNVETLEKQAEVAENRLAAATVVSRPDVRDEEGRPMTDIIEQLDDDDNVLSYRLQTALDTQPQVLEALEKAGIKDLPQLNQEPQPSREPQPSQEPQPSPEPQPNQDPPPDPEFAETLAALARVADERRRKEEMLPDAEPGPDAAPKKQSSKKGVSFADDTKLGHDPGTSSGTPSGNNQHLRATQRLGQIMKTAKEQEKSATLPAVVPEHESPEDAAWRREALEYGMSEIGPVVAEFEVDSDDDNTSYDDSEDDDDEEDEHGRSRYSAIPDDYRARMMALEAKLGVKPFFAAKKLEDMPGIEDSKLPPVGLPDSAERPIESGRPAGRNVRFSDAVDIAQEPNSEEHGPDQREKRQRKTVPVVDIIERGGNAETSQANAKKASKFRMARRALAPPSDALPDGPLNAPINFYEQEKRVAPSGPDGKALASSIVEREPSAEAKEPDELDATLLHQEVAFEYHRRRNQLIAKEGGFTKEDESVMTPLDEAEGGPKRMSRFKAARLSKQ